MNFTNDLGLSVSHPAPIQGLDWAFLRYPFTTNMCLLALDLGLDVNSVLQIGGVKDICDAERIIDAASYCLDFQIQLPDVHQWMCRAALYVKGDFSEDGLVLTSVSVTPQDHHFTFTREPNAPGPEIESPAWMTPEQLLSHWHPAPHGLLVSCQVDGKIVIHTLDQTGNVKSFLKLVDDQQMAAFLKSRVDRIHEIHIARVYPDGKNLPPTSQNKGRRI